MKLTRKLLTVILSLALCLGMMTVMTHAEVGDTFDVDWFTYEILSMPNLDTNTKGTVKLTKFAKTDNLPTEIIIPETVQVTGTNSGGYEVVEIDAYALALPEGTTQPAIVIPGSVTTIGTSVFGIDTLYRSQVKVLYTSAKTVKSGAFDNASAVSHQMAAPQNLTYWGCAIWQNNPYATAYTLYFTNADTSAMVGPRLNNVTGAGITVDVAASDVSASGTYKFVISAFSPVSTIDQSDFVSSDAFSLTPLTTVTAGEIERTSNTEFTVPITSSADVEYVVTTVNSVDTQSAFNTLSAGTGNVTGTVSNSAAGSGEADECYLIYRYTQSGVTHYGYTTLSVPAYVEPTPTAVQVTTEKELIDAVNAGTAIGIEIVDDMYISGKTITTDIPITVKSGNTLSLYVSDITAPLTVESGATVMFGDGGRNKLGGAIVNNGTITVDRYTHYIYGTIVNNGSITNASNIIYDWGKLINNGTIDGVIRCNVAAQVGVKPSLSFATTDITVGDTIQLVGTGFIDGVDLETVLKCSWTVGGGKVNVTTPYYDTTGAALDRSIKCESVTFRETDTVKYVAVTASGSGGSPDWLDGNKSIRPQPILYDVVYLGGELGNDANTGNSENAPFKSLQVAMTAVKPDGKIIMVGDAQVVKLDGEYANEAWTNFTANVTVEGNGYKLLNNANNSYRTLYVTGATLTINNVVLEPASGYRTLNFKGQSSASIIFNNCSGTYANISGFTNVTLNGTSLTSSGLTSTYMSATNLALNNGSTLYAQFSVENLTSQGAASTIYTRYGNTPKISVSYSTENPVNVIIEEAAWSNFKTAQNIINFSAKNVGMAMLSDFNVVTTLDGRSAVKDVKNSQYLTARFAYTVTFKHNDGVTGDYVDYTNRYDKLDFLPAPTRTGYIFDGWFDAPENGNEVTTSTVFTADTTVYAYWTLCDHSGNTTTPDCVDTVICSVCGGDVPAIGHDFANSTVWVNTDPDGHYRECTRCDVTDVENKIPHDFDHNCDTECNTCGFTRTITHDFSDMKASETEHWYQCSVCGTVNTDSIEAHGGTATCLDKAKCPTCETEYGELAPDNHASDKFNYAQAGYNVHVKSHACCGVIVNANERHVWGEGDRICDLCGYDGTHYHTYQLGYADNGDGVSHSIYYICCGLQIDAFDKHDFEGNRCRFCSYVKPDAPADDVVEEEIIPDIPVESEIEETEESNPVTGIGLSLGMTALAAALAVWTKKR